MCTETPEAKVGDPCTTDGYHPCLPTRAQLNTDGTVAGQTYLACGGSKCISASPPDVFNYLQVCDSTIVAQYGTQTSTACTPLHTTGSTCACSRRIGGEWPQPHVYRRLGVSCGLALR